jgi:dihydrofolate synthase/folylpolyglutamate synthase
LAAQLGERFVAGERHAVVGMLADKAIEEVLAALAPRVDHWHLLELGDQPRGAPAKTLLDALPAAACAGAHCCTDVDDCLSALDTRLGVDDEVLVFGSFVTVGRVMAWLDAHPSGL